MHADFPRFRTAQLPVFCYNDGLRPGHPDSCFAYSYVSMHSQYYLLPINTGVAAEAEELVKDEKHLTAVVKVGVNSLSAGRFWSLDPFALCTGIFNIITDQTISCSGIPQSAATIICCLMHGQTMPNGDHLLCS